jgi:hypothetical protein
MVVVGGLGTVRGPIIGAFVVTMLSELLRDTVMWRLVVQGALLLIVLAFWPAGIDGLLERAVSRVRAWMNVGQGESEGGAQVAVAAEGPAVKAAALAVPTEPAAQPPETVVADDVTASASPKPPKKAGGFKAWLNADQPQADGKKSGGAKGGKKT